MAVPLCNQIKQQLLELGGTLQGRVHIAKVVPEQYRYVRSAVYVNTLCRQ